MIKNEWVDDKWFYWWKVKELMRNEWKREGINWWKTK